MAGLGPARKAKSAQILSPPGFSETWWYDAKQKNSDISESFKRGQAKGLAEVSNAIYEQAMKGTRKTRAFLKNQIRVVVGCEVCECGADQCWQMTDTQLLDGVEV
ncbi:MAG: hypothetical protein CM15mP45_17500 [Deltaproteobacteria bacterium]|nr:MAG: hypothetical protein CM15mP45_17500 [Deltaproteobacteria bacterium]